MTWPDGLSGGMHIDAAARDLATRPDGSATEVEAASMSVLVDSGRILRSLSMSPSRDLDELLGQGGGSGYRRRLQALVPEDMTEGRLPYFLLDDMPGVTLVGPFAWRLWPVGLDMMTRSRRHPGPGYDMTGICSGFRADGVPVQRINSGEDPQHNLVPAFDLAEPGDPLAWHDIPAPPGDSPMLRRRRRIDVIDGPEVTVDSLFRDSMWSPEGVETVVHEYGVHAVVDRDSMRLASITADPRVLPFTTCPAAAGNVDLLVGEPMGTLRHRVLEQIVSTDGCTHLNDALRALAEVPVLFARLASAASPA